MTSQEYSHQVNRAMIPQRTLIPIIAPVCICCENLIASSSIFCLTSWHFFSFFMISNFKITIFKIKARWITIALGSKLLMVLKLKFCNSKGRVKGVDKLFDCCHLANLISRKPLLGLPRCLRSREVIARSDRLEVESDGGCRWCAAESRPLSTADWSWLRRRAEFLPKYLKMITEKHYKVNLRINSSMIDAAIFLLDLLEKVSNSPCHRATCKAYRLVPRWKAY